MTCIERASYFCTQISGVSCERVYDLRHNVTHGKLRTNGLLVDQHACMRCAQSLRAGKRRGHASGNRHG